MSAEERVAEVLRLELARDLGWEPADPALFRIINEALSAAGLLPTDRDQRETRTEWALLRPNGTQATEVITTEDEGAARQRTRGYIPRAWRLHRREVEVGPWVEVQS